MIRKTLFIAGLVAASGGVTFGYAEVQNALLNITNLLDSLPQILKNFVS